MKKYLQTIKQTKLFKELNDAEVINALGCLNASVRRFSKGEVIFVEGDISSFIGIVLNGEIEIQKIGFDGNVNIISKLFSAEVIGAVAFYSSEKYIPFDAVAVTNSEILCLGKDNLIRPCCNACLFHMKIIENMIEIIADKNIQLTEKINVLTKRTIREKLLAYLYSQSQRTKNKKFAISLTRQQMADYLSVNRSALSRELANMKEAGLLDYEDNIFWFK